MKPLEIETLPLNGTVCIEASAGTGKTYTIGLIVLRLVMERGLEFAKLAVVTFTDAATGELAERIAHFLRIARDYAASGARTEGDDEIYSIVDSAREKAGENVIRRLDDALLNFDLARISTIHGFCSRILNEYAFETGSSFGMEVIEDQEELIDQILSDFWRKEISTLDQRFNRLLGKVTPESLRKDFRELLSFPGLVVEGPSISREDMESCFKSLAALGKLWIESRKEILSMLNVPDRFKTKAYFPTEENLSQFAANLDSCFDESLLDFKVIKLISHDALDNQIYAPARKKGFTLPALPIFQKAQDFISAYSLLPDSFNASIRTQAYKYLIIELKKRLTTLRLRSYNNMISDLADGLERGGEHAASLIRQRFSAVLVDEFQDTDALQYKIFHQLFFGKEDIFFAMIGDPKQAIYRFRGGDINTYVRARNEVPEENRFTLANNYRSEKRLIDAVNGIYEIDNPDFNGQGPFLTKDIGYIKVAAKRNLPPPSQGGKIVPPITLWNVPDGETPDLKIIGKRIAKAIIELMSPDDPLIIGLENSPLRLQDIAILVNSHFTAGLLKNILADYGIRSVVGKSGSIFQTDEAEDLVLLMEAILNPSKEKTVRALLISSLYGFDLDALTAWESDDAARIATVSELNEGKDRWLEDGIASALNHILNRTGVFALSDDPKQELFQERRITNFRHLIEILHSEELRTGRFPERLLSAFVRMKTNEDGFADNEDMEQRLESDYDAVQIYTMHKSKGLQWPVVFTPELWREGIRKNLSSAPIFYEDGYRKADLSPEKYDEIKIKVQDEIRQERMRIAYVIMTRAESLLFAVTANKPKTPKNKPVLPDLSPSALLLRSPKLGLLKDKDGPLVNLEMINLELLISLDENIRFRTLSKQTQKRALQKWDDEHELSAKWSVGSYSGLTRGISHEPVLTEPDLTVPEGIFAFPKGADAGIALHSVFERIDFIDAARISDPPPEEIVRLIEGILTDSGFSPKKDPGNIDHVIAMIKNVMQSEIPSVAPKFRLGGLRGENRLAEMEFHLTAGHPDSGKAPVTAMKLKEALGSEIGQISDGKQLEGFLKGFIDLVFRHDGKWWILDWKSNHLGNSSGCYGHEALERAMKEHNYHLQYHFYTAALTRYLTVASGGEFDYERDFGGVLYLFIRGVDVTGNGIYYARPDRDVMKKLEDIL